MTHVGLPAGPVWPIRTGTGTGLEKNPTGCISGDGGVVVDHDKLILVLANSVDTHKSKE